MNNLSDLAIYCLTDKRFPGKVKYIGLTRLGAKRRFLDHLRTARNGKGAPVYVWMRSIGLENVQMHTLEFVESVSLLPDREIYWIAKYKSLGHALTNANDGGSATAMFPETKAKISASKLGKKRTAEQSARMREIFSDGRRKGSLHPRAKLTEVDVREIRRLARIPGNTKNSLAKSFNVSPASIMDIKHGRSWSHIA